MPITNPTSSSTDVVVVITTDDSWSPLPAPRVESKYFKAPVSQLVEQVISFSGLNPVKVRNALGALEDYTPKEGERLAISRTPDRSYNGIWNASSNSWSRASDMQWSNDFGSGILVPVEDGRILQMRNTAGDGETAAYVFVNAGGSSGAIDPAVLVSDDEGNTLKVGADGKLLVPAFDQDLSAYYQAKKTEEGI